MTGVQTCALPISDKEYGNFEFRCEYRWEKKGGNSGVGLRTPEKGDPAYAGMEIQLIDDEGWPGRHAGLPAFSRSSRRARTMMVRPLAMMITAPTPVQMLGTSSKMKKPNALAASSCTYWKGAITGAGPHIRARATQ